MEEDAPRIRRRVSVRKRNRLSIYHRFASQVEAELKPSAQEKEGEDEGEDEEERVAGCRRRKTLSPPLAQHNDSEEDMFGDYDSFAENSILAQFDDLEQKHMQISDHRTHDLDVTAEKFHSEDIKRNKFSVLAGSNLLEERIDDSLHDSQIGNGEVSEESEINVLFDMPSSQLLYFENLNHAPDTLDNQTAATEQVRIPSCQKADKEELPHTSTEQPPKINDSSYAQPSSDVNRRKSLKERLKTAMTSNARVQTPAFSKTKQLKETLLNEEINVAKKTIELSSDDLGPFYSLPSKTGSIHA